MILCFQRIVALLTLKTVLPILVEETKQKTRTILLVEETTQKILQVETTQTALKIVLVETTQIALKILLVEKPQMPQTIPLILVMEIINLQPKIRPPMVQSKTIQVRETLLNRIPHHQRQPDITLQLNPQ